MDKDDTGGDRNSSAVSIDSLRGESVVSPPFSDRAGRSGETAGRSGMEGMADSSSW